MAVKIFNTENFAKLREGGGYYVDKTGFLETFLDSPDDAILFTRPRRFGKSLFISMLAEFFDVTKDSRELFAGLKVAANEKLCEAWMNQYPVLSLTLKKAHAANFNSALSKVRKVIADLCEKHDYLLSSSALGKRTRKSLEALYEEQTDQETLEDALHILSKAMWYHYGKPAIVLIDEYDAPISNAEGKEGYYEPMCDFMRDFLSNGLKTNEYLKFGILTGCLRIAKESYFSDLSNVKCYDILNNSRYEDVFGFTQGEVDQLLIDAGFADRSDIIRDWYDGYCFGNRTDIYCPWSVMQYLDDLQGNPSKKPDAYWVSTGKYELPKNFVNRLPAEEDVQGKMAALLGGFSIAVQLNSMMNYSEVFTDANNFWTLLFLAGFLTLTNNSSSSPEEKAVGESLLIIPNREVREVFQREVQGWFASILPKLERQALYAALWDRDVQEFEKQLTAVLVRSSFRDAKEMYYHGMLYGIFAIQYEETTSNGEAGRGLYDLVVPDKAHGRAAVLEFKKAASSEEMDKDVQEALQQIREMQYDTRLRAEGYRTIFHVGVAFCQKTARAAFREAGVGKAAVV